MPRSNASFVDTGDVSWHLSKRILFRFAFCYIVLHYTPHVLSVIPGLALSLKWYENLWRTVSISLFNVDPLPYPTGSGDTTLAYIQQATVLVLAFVTGILWTLFDRHRVHYIRLYSWLRILARYALAFALFSYASRKIIPTQFLPLQNRQLTETYGQSSPMGLLWNFMGFSTPYIVFSGFAELLPAVLLVFRRTALLGSLIAFAVLLNVVALNFCYDVPVKLYSLNLLSLSVFLILPESQRLLKVFVLNQPVASANLSGPLFRNRWSLRTAMVLKIVVLTIFASQTIYSAIGRYRTYSARISSPSSPLTTRGFHWIQDDPYNR